MRIIHKTGRCSLVLLGLLTCLTLSVPVGAEESEEPGAAQFLEGRHLQQLGEWAASMGQFRAAADVYSIVADYALYQMAQSAFQIGDTESAASALEELLNLYPDTPVRRVARLELANLYCDTGKSAQAVPLIESVLPGAASSREIVDLMLMLAKAYAASDDIAKSDSICWQLIHGWPKKSEAVEAAELVRGVDTPRRQLAIAKVYVLNRKSRKALTVLEELVADPDAADLMPEILLYLAQALELSGRKQDASDLYDKIIADYPDSTATATALFERAEYKRSLSVWDGALADYLKLIELFPHSEQAPESLWKRAKVLERLDREDEYAQYERILGEYPRSARAHSGVMYWGVKLFRKGESGSARRVFETLLAAHLNPNADADATFWTAKCMLAEGEDNSAKIQLANIIGRFNNSYQAFRARAILQGLAQVQSVYSQGHMGVLEGLLAVDQRDSVSPEVKTAEEAFVTLEKELSYWDRKAMKRLKFLMLNRLTEARWELEHISPKLPGADARYAMAWGLFQTRSYYKSISVASSLKGTVPEALREARIQQLLYPIAYADLVDTAASKYEIDPLLAMAVMREESHFRENAVSSSDACGLMQIIPPTGEWLAGKVFGAASFDRSTLFLPHVNIELGSYYLRYLLDKFDNKPVLVIAAYNWGETNLRKWMSDSPPVDLDIFIETIPVQETRRYVKKVLRSYAVYYSLYPPDFLPTDQP
jgi:soluble lytic murein transglycosylase-like protein/TolA-binding protein